MRQGMTAPFPAMLEGKTTRHHFVATAAILFLAGWIMAGCGARHLTGSPIKEEGMRNIVIGKTTRADILNWFGPPYHIESKEDGETLTYFYGKQSSWTIVLYSESRQSADILDVYLNKNGIVSHYAFSEGAAIPVGHFSK